ncbi:MAG: hypothetical protein N3G79_04680 [Sulfolobales archaeon]|nr:hypothetical protein [Sulfolobales archaeon]
MNEYTWVKLGFPLSGGNPASAATTSTTPDFPYLDLSFLRDSELKSIPTYSSGKVRSFFVR